MYESFFNTENKSRLIKYWCCTRWRSYKPSWIPDRVNRYLWVWRFRNTMNSVQHLQIASMSTSMYVSYPSELISVRGLSIVSIRDKATKKLKEHNKRKCLLVACLNCGRTASYSLIRVPQNLEGARVSLNLGIYFYCYLVHTFISSSQRV